MGNDIFKHRLPVCISVTSLITIYHKVPMYNKKPRPESHDFPELFFVRECSDFHRLLLDDRQYMLKKGQLMIYPPNAVHKIIFPSNSVIDIISFDTDSDLSDLYGRVITLNIKQMQMLEEVMTEGVRLFLDTPCVDYAKGMSLHNRANDFALQSFKNGFESFLLDLCLCEMKEEMRCESNREISLEEQFERVVSYMKRNIDKPLSLDDLATAFSFSVTKIQKLFYRYADCAPMQYFMDLKLAAAKKMMCGTALNYTQISAMLGFSSVSYFSRLFKKRTGLTPSEYVKSLE